MNKQNNHFSRLYKSLGDYDVIEGIMSEHGSSEVTSKGLKLEASGSFAEAKKVYETVSSAIFIHYYYVRKQSKNLCTFPGF